MPALLAPVLMPQHSGVHTETRGAGGQRRRPPPRRRAVTAAAASWLIADVSAAGNNLQGSTAASRSKSKSNLSVVRTVPQRHVWGSRNGSRPRSLGAPRRNGSGTTNVYVPPNSSAGSDSIQGSPASDNTSPTHHQPVQREPSSTSSAPGAYIPPPPPGYAYSIVPASSPAALIVGGPGSTAHMPYPLPSVQEGLPVSPREYDVSPDTMPWLMQGDSPDVPYMDATTSVGGGDGDTCNHTAAYPVHTVLDSEGRTSAPDSAYESTVDTAAGSEYDEVPEMPQDVAAVAGVRAPIEDSGMLDSSFLGAHTSMNRPLMGSGTRPLARGEPGPVAEQVQPPTTVLHATGQPNGSPPQCARSAPLVPRPPPCAVAGGALGVACMSWRRGPSGRQPGFNEVGRGAGRVAGPRVWPVQRA